MRLQALIVALLLLVGCASGETPQTADAGTDAAGASEAQSPEASASEDAAAAPAADPDAVELSMTADFDGLQLEAMEQLIADFQEANPDVVISLDTVSYEQVLEALPLRLETGEAPDIMKLTDLQLAEHFLDLSEHVDTGYWNANLGPTSELLSPGGDPRPRGLFMDVTVSGPFINRTLFEQAGVEVPSDSSEEVTWEEWAEVSRQVAEATGTDFPMAMDRSGHRLAGPAVSQGASYELTDDGGVALTDDEGFRRMVDLMVQWHDDGTMPLDVWAGGSSYREADAEFSNANLVTYVSGNWQISTFTETIGDAFDWEAVPPPCGPTGICTGMPGGSFLVGNAGTENPDEVAAFLDFLAQEDNYRFWAESTGLVPQHEGLLEAGLDYSALSPPAQEALEVFAVSSTEVDPIAQELQRHPAATLVFDTTRDRLTQVLLDELTVDEALARMEQDIAEGVAGTGG